MALGGICVTGSLWQTYYICLTLTINTFTYLSFKGTNISLGSLLKLRIQRITLFFFWLGSLHNANAKTSLIFCQCIYWMWRCCLIFSFLYLNKKKKQQQHVDPSHSSLTRQHRGSLQSSRFQGEGPQDSSHQFSIWPNVNSPPVETWLWALGLSCGGWCWQHIVWGGASMVWIYSGRSDDCLDWDIGHLEDSRSVRFLRLLLCCICSVADCAVPLVDAARCSWLATVFGCVVCIKDPRFPSWTLNCNKLMNVISFSRQWFLCRGWLRWYCCL